MNILILSQKKDLYSTKRLAEAAKDLNHPIEIFDPLSLSLALKENSPSIVSRQTGKQLSKVDVVLPRIGYSIMDYGLSVVNHFQIMGIPSINEALPIAISRDKFRSLQLLSSCGIDIPKTVMIKQVSQVDDAIRLIGGLPAIVKRLRGTQGTGVMLAETRESLLNIIWNLKQSVIIQEFIQESRGKDVRVLIVGGRQVAAMRREAIHGEFRSNIHRGGSGKEIVLPKEYRQTALKAVKVIGLEVAGIDMLEAREGPKVIEINSSPGFEGLEKTTGKNIAHSIIKYAARRAKASRKL